MAKVENQEVKGLTGDQAVAYALLNIDPDVVPAYPITPQTIIMEKFSEFWADGLVKTELVHVESEHSAMSAAVGASATGARVFTATASQGVALMYEILFIASGSRLPIVMAVANRALSAPINIHGELTDQLVTRDAGWVSFIGEDAQEAYDHTIIGFKIAEYPEVSLPFMYGLEGFIVTHALEPVYMLDKKTIYDFIGEFREPSNWVFAPGNPGAQGLLALPDYYMELKYQQEQGMKNARKVIPKVLDEFGEITGRYYHEVEPFHMEDAKYAFITAGASSGTAKAVVQRLRSKGEPVGMVKLRTIRPYPDEQLSELLKDLDGVMVVDRSVTFGSPASIQATDLASALLKHRKFPRVLSSAIVGLGGRDITEKDFEGLYEQLKKDVQEDVSRTHWWGVRI